MKQIAEGFYQISKPVGVNMYLIKDADGLTLIDTSISSAGKGVLEEIQKAGWKPSDLKRILITHAHPDHVGGLPFLKQATGAQVYASALEREVIEGRIDIPRRPKGLSMPKTRLAPTPVDQVINEGDVLPDVMGGMCVLMTPGHAPGHVAFWQPERKILIAGDVLFNLFGLTLPPGPLTVDMDEDKRSVGKLAGLNAEIAGFGHGPVITEGTAGKLRAKATKIGVPILEPMQA